jgi:hypothetical protein
MKTCVVNALMLVILFQFFPTLTVPGAWAAPAPIDVKPSSKTAQPQIPSGENIPFSELGTRAGKQYSGEALSVIATQTGAQLRTDFQRLQGEVTEQGLALESSVAGQPRERFALRADAIGREGGSAVALPHLGRVETQKGLARWLRPQVTEEFTVSVDGVRQDFILTERPVGEGTLHLVLALSGARAESTSYGALLTLDGSGRKLAYSRLKAWDAAGRELPARMAASGPDRLTVLVEDSGAVWPLRIDPTFSDANWVSMGAVSVLNNGVDALAIDGSGNLYAGGSFTKASGVSVNYIAKWDGSAWFPLGSGMDGSVNALAIDKSGNLYAGGWFQYAGGVSANSIAKWNGSTWSPLGSGIAYNTNPADPVLTLAIDITGNLYAGGMFTTAGG